MENIINLGIPHVGEQIFKSLNTEDLIQFLEVSQTWQILAGNVLFPRCKDKLFEACEDGQTNILFVCLFCARPAYGYYPISDYGMSYLDLILGLRRVHLMAGPGISSGCALFTHFAAFATYFRHTRGVLRT